MGFQDTFHISTDGTTSNKCHMDMKMGGWPFHEWYQEWSTYDSQSGANEATKMYAFCQAIPQGLNNRLVGITLVSMHLAELVRHAKEFDQQFHLWK